MTYFHPLANCDDFIVILIPDLNFTAPIRASFESTSFVGAMLTIKDFNLQRVQQVFRTTFAIQNRLKQLADFPRVHLISQNELILESGTFAIEFNDAKSGCLQCFKDGKTNIMANYYNGTAKSYSKIADIQNIGEVQFCAWLRWLCIIFRMDFWRILQFFSLIWFIVNLFLE